MSKGVMTYVYHTSIHVTFEIPPGFEKLYQQFVTYIIWSVKMYHKSLINEGTENQVICNFVIISVPSDGQAP